MSTSKSLRLIHRKIIWEILDSCCYNNLNSSNLHRVFELLFNIIFHLYVRTYVSSYVFKFLYAPRGHQKEDKRYFIAHRSLQTLYPFFQQEILRTHFSVTSVILNEKEISFFQKQYQMILCYISKVSVRTLLTICSNFFFNGRRNIVSCMNISRK